MLNLDNYINNSMEVQLFGETINIIEPTVAMISQVTRIEENIPEEPITEMVNAGRIEVALLMLNHNKEGKTFKKEDLMRIPIDGIVELIEQVSRFRFEAETDPN